MAIIEGLAVMRGRGYLINLDKEVFLHCLRNIVRGLNVHELGRAWIMSYLKVEGFQRLVY
jgi:hypothetical protein